MSAGNLNEVPPGSPSLAVLNPEVPLEETVRETLMDWPTQRVPVQGTTAQEMPKEGPVQEAPLQEEPGPEEPELEESGDILKHDMPIQVEMVAVDVPLGTDGAHADATEPQSGDATGGDASAPPGVGGGLMLGLGHVQPQSQPA
jgi:hypothetical protein